MNYYDVLRVDKNASTQEIKDSYKKLIKRYHPDLYPGNKTKAESITRDLNEAYDVLSDAEKRALYDLSLQEPEIVEPEPKVVYSPPPPQYAKKYYYQQNSQKEEQEKPGFEEKLKENIHTFVDKHSETIDDDGKKKVTLIIIILALTILLLAIKDFLDFQVAIKNKETENRIEQELIEQEELKKKLLENYIYEQMQMLNQNTISNETIENNEITENNTITE